MKFSMCGIFLWTQKLAIKCVYTMNGLVLVSTFTTSHYLGMKSHYLKIVINII